MAPPPVEVPDTEQLQQAAIQDRPELAAVVLDPDRRYWLDLDLSDNSWYAQRDGLVALRWSERVLNRWLHLLHWQAGIGG